MSWRSLRTSDHLTNISKLVLTQQHHQQQQLLRHQLQQQAFSHSTTVTTATRNTRLATIMKLLKPNSITNITIFFAASLVAAWSMPPLLVDGNELDRDSKNAAVAKDDAAAATAASSASAAAKTAADKTAARSKNCPSYGCPLFPRDIFFDKEAQAALQIIRNLQQQNVNNNNNNQQHQQEKQGEQPQNTHLHNFSGQESISLFYNEAYINTDRSEDQATLTLIGYKGGQVHEQINQDRAFVISPFYINTSASTTQDDDSENDVGMDDIRNEDKAIRLLGVFDGHAKLGEQVSEYSVRHLPHLLSSKLESILSSSSSYENQKQQQQQEIQDAINDTFIEIDKTAPAHISGGCTASIVLQIHSHVYVANAGDSRSFIATYNKKTQQTSVAYITREDKPDIPEERQRVENAGGIVYIPPPDRVLSGASSRVVYVDKHTGARNGLAMSRSIGDWAAGDHGVIPNPKVEVLDIKELIRNASTGTDLQCNTNYEEEKKGDSIANEVCNEIKDNDDGSTTGDVEVFAVSATDGLLDFMDVEAIAKTVAMSLYVKDSPHPLSACESLITTAASSWWQAKSGRYRDDIAIAVSKLSLS